MIRDTGQHVRQIAFGIDPVQLGRTEQTVNRSGTFSTTIGARTKKILSAESPSGTGTVDVTVTTPGGTSTPTPADQFTYASPLPIVAGISPNSGPAAGGTVVTISGTGFTDVTGVASALLALSTWCLTQTTPILN